MACLDFLEGLFVERGRVVEGCSIISLDLFSTCLSISPPFLIQSRKCKVMILQAVRIRIVIRQGFQRLLLRGVIAKILSLCFPFIRPACVDHDAVGAAACPRQLVDGSVTIRQSHISHLHNSWQAAKVLWRDLPFSQLWLAFRLHYATIKIPPFTTGFSHIALP